LSDHIDKVQPASKTTAAVPKGLAAGWSERLAEDFGKPYMSDLRKYLKERKSRKFVIGVPVPPSLANIYKEMHSDLGIEPASHGFLEPWAEQGVLLLNSVLTVEKGNANSHQGRGWESFTDRVIQVLSEENEHLVFMLWGSYAQKKGQIIDHERHCVLKAPHPSPLSAHRGFLGCRHFSLANEYLNSKGRGEIRWSLS